MESFWEVPDENFVKINVHCVIAEQQAPNGVGNLKAVGVIIRDSKGEDLWKALGILPGLTEEQAIMTGLQAACDHAITKEWDLTHIETVSQRVYDTIGQQDMIMLNDDQLEVYRNFNTIFANNFKEGITKRRIACIPRFMNTTAEYLANYGLANMSEFGEVEHSVGDLEFHLARDMGRTLPPPFVMGNLILGDGEMDKGKDKVLAHYAFGNNGALRPEAVKILDSGKLSCYSDEFAKQVVNLDAVVGNGIYAKDVLHHALKGTLQKIIKRLYVAPKPADHLEEISGFMTVEQVLAMMGLAPDEDSSSKASGSGDA
ncbi:hypothetical protein ACET3Z_011572 [Daucus carota]